MTRIFGAVCAAAASLLLLAASADAANRGGWPGGGGGGGVSVPKMGGGGGSFPRVGGGGGGGFKAVPRGNWNGPKMGGPRMGGPRVGNNWIGKGKHGGWQGGGGKGHHGHYRRHRGGRYFVYGAPYFYDDYYAYSAYSGDSCYWMWRRYLATGNAKWKYRYYECID